MKNSLFVFAIGLMMSCSVWAQTNHHERERQPQTQVTNVKSTQTMSSHLSRMKSRRDQSVERTTSRQKTQVKTSSIIKSSYITNLKKSKQLDDERVHRQRFRGHASAQANPLSSTDASRTQALRRNRPMSYYMQPSSDKSQSLVEGPAQREDEVMKRVRPMSTYMQPTKSQRQADMSSDQQDDRVISKRKRHMSTYFSPRKSNSGQQ